ncbi:MAG: hypothetical protein M1472_04095 [Planctomycetes bacterium]|nr:hypothetical protein [Planctomycetota bacterium]
MIPPAESDMDSHANTSADALTVWGYSPSALHDLFWLSREVAIVRSGSTAPLSPEARVFLLISPGRLFRLHLRYVLDRLFWMPRAMYLIGLNPPPRHHSAAEKKLPRSTPHDPTQVPPEKLMVHHYSSTVAPAARLALTTHRPIAEFWRTISTVENQWMSLRRRYPDYASLKVPGLAYADHGRQALEYLQALTRDWSDPEAAIPSITRLAYRVRGLTGFDMSTLNIHTRPLWIGRGNVAAGADPNSCILPDASPASMAAVPIMRRKL